MEIVETDTETMAQLDVSDNALHRSCSYRFVRTPEIKYVLAVGYDMLRGYATLLKSFIDHFNHLSAETRLIPDKLL